MAQLRQDYHKFEQANIEIVVVGPEPAFIFRTFWANNNLSFIGLSDPKHTVLKQYGQEVNLFKLGRLPAQVLIDHNGIVRFAHYGKSMADIPDTETILDSLAPFSNSGQKEIEFNHKKADSLMTSN